MCDKRGQRSTDFSLFLLSLIPSVLLLSLTVKAALSFHSNPETFLTLRFYPKSVCQCEYIPYSGPAWCVFFSLFFWRLESLWTLIIWNDGQTETELRETAISTITACVCVCVFIWSTEYSYASSTISDFSSLFLFFFMNINAITLGSESCSAPQQTHKHETRKKKIYRTLTRAKAAGTG